MHKHPIQICGKRYGFVVIRVFALMLICAVSPARALGESADELFERGQRAEARLDLFGARADFRRAMEIDPRLLGLIDHTAWFFI